MENCIVMDVRDNVATVLARALPGTALAVLDPERRPVGQVVSVSSIPFGHKICLSAIGSGGDIIKYGEVIGRATEAIGVGEYAHIHNIISIEGSGKSSG